MRAVIQRVSRAKVEFEDSSSNKINEGLVVLLGVAKNDTQEDALKLAQKIAAMRIFENENGKMDLSALDIKAEVLAVSQFTLLANCAKGLRPDFTAAARPEEAQPLYNYFCECLRETGLKVEEGKFKEHMLVCLENNGPVTIIAQCVNGKMV